MKLNDFISGNIDDYYPSTQKEIMSSNQNPELQDGIIRQNWTIMDIGSIVISISGLVFTLLPWGVFQSRLAMVDLLLMVTPAFIFVAALLTFAGTALCRKDNGIRNSMAAMIARLLIWTSIVLLIIPIMVKFITLLIAG